MIVSGRVQGVAFRYATRAEARRLGLGGFVRNRPDGRVEAAFEGSAAAVDAALAFVRRGPPLARVSGVEVREEPPAGAADFEIR